MELGLVLVIGILFGRLFLWPRKRAKVFHVDSATWSSLLRERKDGRGWRRKSQADEP